MEYYFHRVHSSRISQEGATEVALRPTFPDNSVYGSWGLFLQDEASLSSDLTATAGVRFGRESMNSPLEIPFERYQATFTDLTGSLALCYLITPKVNLVGRWSRGFRSPNLNDAVVLKYSSSGVDAPNSELGPETLYCYEIGAKVASHTAQGSFFVFYNQLKDLIDRRPGTYNGLRFFDENGNGIQDGGEQPVFQKANVGRARIMGFEFAGRIRLSHALQGRTSLSWTYGVSVSDDEPLSRIPRCKVCWQCARASAGISGGKRLFDSLRVSVVSLSGTLTTLGSSREVPQVGAFLIHPCNTQSEISQSQHALKTYLTARTRSTDPEYFRPAGELVFQLGELSIRKQRLIQ